MQVADMVAHVDEGLARLGRFLNREDSATEMTEETRRLSQILRERQAFLKDSLRRVESVLARIIEQRNRAADLTEQIRLHMLTGNRTMAWPTALELDRVNQALDADRRDLAHLQTACLGCQAQIARVERDLAAVQFRLFPD